MPGYTWINDPPIVEVPHNEVQQLVKDFNKGQKPIGENPDVFTERYANKANDAIGIADGMGKNFDALSIALKKHKKAEEKVFKYVLDGVAVGVIHITIEADYVYIDHVVGHAGAENAGDILIEYILRHSPVNPPKVKLFAATKAAFNRYKTLGFVPNEKNADKGGMTLDLSRKPGSDAWKKVNNKWKRARYANVGYLTNTA